MLNYNEVEHPSDSLLIARKIEARPDSAVKEDWISSVIMNCAQLKVSVGGVVVCSSC